MNTSIICQQDKFISFVFNSVSLKIYLSFPLPTEMTGENEDHSFCSNTSVFSSCGIVEFKHIYCVIKGHSPFNLEQFNEASMIIIPSVFHYSCSTFLMRTVNVI